ncbi:MAG: hypothetical protein GQ559_01530 [Desulfobulbaceae bacterium]|nr:hypothetical protein [Desulfobulbaceae bacterium]
MKRFFSLILFIAVIGGAAYLLSMNLRKEPDPVDFVPADSMALVDWSAPAGAYSRFQATTLGSQLVDTDWSLALQALGFSGAQCTELRQKAQQVKGVVQSPLFKELFGRRAVLALLTDEKKEIDLAPALLARKFVLLLKPKHNASLVELSSIFIAGDYQVDNEVYQGFSIKTFTLENKLSISVANADGILVAALSPDPVKKCLDNALELVIRGDIGIKSNMTYAGLKKRSRNKDDLFIYLDLSRIKSLTVKNDTFVQPAVPLIKTDPTYKGVTTAVFYHISRNDTEQFTSIVQFDEEQLAPFQGTIYRRRPIDNRKLKSMPADLLVYFWTNWLDLATWWKTTEQSSIGTEADAAMRLEKWVEENIGREMQSFLSMFGREFFFYVKEIKTSGFFPVPRICMCMEVREPKAISELLEKTIVDLPVRRDKVAGISVVSVMVAGGLMQPSYALYENFLILADGRDLIESILLPGAKVLVTDQDFKKVDMGFQQQNNMTVFIRTAGVIEGLKEFVSWLGTIIAIRDEKAGKQSKIIIDRIVLPLLDSLKMFRAKGVRSYTSEGELVLESTILTQ